MDIHVRTSRLTLPIWGDKIKDHMRKVDTNPALFLNFNCQWCISLLIDHALIIWDKIKTLQVRQQAKKAPDGLKSTRNNAKKQKQKKKSINLNYF